MNYETYSLHNKIIFIMYSKLFNYIMVNRANYSYSYTYIRGNTLYYDHRVVLA
jgi:hypothetical protein